MLLYFRLITYLLFFIILFTVLNCSEDSNPAKSKKGEIPDKLFEISAAEIKGGTEFQQSAPHFKYDVKVYKITYPVAYKGEYVLASGVIAIPQDIESPPLLIDNHGTIERDQWAPSNAVKSDFIYRFAEFASAGYIVLAPDYIGFGESADVFHPWLLPEPGASDVIALIEAGKKLLNEYDCSYDERVFLTGFSEGANITLGAQRAIEQNSSSGISLAASSPGSGAYDMDYTFTNRILGSSATEVIGGIYIIITFREVYDWDDPLSSYFKEPYASALQNLLDEEGTFEDNFSSENIISVDFATGVLNHDTLFSESFINDFENNPGNKIKQKLIENNIYMWKPVTPTMLHYGKDDTTTYFQNTLHAYQEFINRGADPLLITIQGYEGKNHEGSEDPWMKSTLDWFETLR